jgi:molecular chaperone GrpE
MADEKQTLPETEKNPAAAGAPGAEAGAAEGRAAAPPPGPSAAEFAEMKDKLLRSLADAENVRRRAEREVTDARQYAVTSFAREMLQVGDNLRRALEAVPPAKRQEGDATLTALLEGVVVTERGLEQTLGKFGVKRIDAKGKKFDPMLHQAMFELPREDVAPGTVVDEMQVGYVIGDRVLKPSLVVVAKRPPAAGSDDRPKAGDEPSMASGGLGDDG